MPKPGSMLYYDNIEPLAYLSREEKGDLFDAILNYGRDGILPQFDGMLAMAWAFIKPKLDRDDQRYNDTVISKRYATYCREAYKRGETPISSELWAMLPLEQHRQLISGDIR